MPGVLKKHEITCPHCGGKQKESIHAQSTMCRHCGEFVPLAGGAGFAAGKSAPRREFNFIERIKPWFGTEKPRAVVCFECSQRQEVSRAATSSQCNKCGTYLDLRDYKIANSYSRDIRTNGHIIITAKGDLNSTKVSASSAEIIGSLRGNIYCSDELVIRRTGKILGTLRAHRIIIDKKSRIEAVRSIYAHEIIIEGHLQCPHLLVSSGVQILKKGLLRADVEARGFSVDRGGIFEGQLTIGQIQPPKEKDAQIESPKEAPGTAVAPSLDLPGQARSATA